MNAQETTVFIVDDDDAIRDSLRWLFQSRGYKAETFASAQAFLDACGADRSGCLLLDVRMPGMTGIELQDVLAERNFRLPILFLTGHGDIPMAVEAVKKGAADFIEKPFNDNELVDRVAACLRADAARRAQAAGRQSIDARVAQLTPREQEVMKLVLAGRLNKVIAEELGISMRTVEVHRARVLDKMGVRSAVELARLMAGK